MFVHSPKTSSRRKKLRRSKPPIAGRARHLIDQVPYRSTGAVHVSGNKGPAPEYESFLERDAIQLLAMCADVESVISQPERVQYLNAEGIPARYTPDLLVDVLDFGAVLIEVKPLTNLISDRVSPGIQVLARHFMSEGQRFDVLTDDAIRIQPRLGNVQRLRAFLRHCITAGAPERITAALVDGPRRIEELITEIGDPNTWADILGLVAKQELCIDWMVPLSVESVVSLPDAPFARLSYEQIVCSGRFRVLLDELVLGRRPTDQRLLAAAVCPDRSIPLSDAFAAVGGIPKRALYVGREVDECHREDDDARLAPASSCVVLEQQEGER